MLCYYRQEVIQFRVVVTAQIYKILKCTNALIILYDDFLKDCCVSTTRGGLDLGALSKFQVRAQHNNYMLFYP